MKIELEKEDLELIAQSVFQKLSPLLKTLKKEKQDIMENMMTVEEAAKYLGVNNSFIRKKVQTSEIPYFKVGKYLRFRKSEMDKWLESNSFKTVNRSLECW